MSNAAFPYLTAREIPVGRIPTLAVRVTYVGELGWELYAPTEYGLELWDTLWEAGRPHGLVAAGYRAIDSLRLEKGYRYWSADITPDDTPYEAGLGFAVKLGKGEFLGRDALARQKAAGVRRKLACLTLSDPGWVALGGEPVRVAGQVVGRVTSGGFGYSLGLSIAYAYLPVEPGGSGDLGRRGVLRRMGRGAGGRRAPLGPARGPDPELIPYDPRRADVVADPYPALGRLREEDPVHWSGILGGWVLTRYADVRATSRIRGCRPIGSRPSWPVRRPTASESIQALLRHVGLWVVFNDPPVHTRLRNALGRAFTARSIEARRAADRGDRRDPAGPRGRGRGDGPDPGLRVSAARGRHRRPPGRPARGPRAAEGVVGRSGGLHRELAGTPDKYERAARAVAEMRDYFRRVVARRREAPADDLVTALLAPGSGASVSARRS